MQLFEKQFREKVFVLNTGIVLLFISVFVELFFSTDVNNRTINR